MHVVYRLLSAETFRVRNSDFSLVTQSMMMRKRAALFQTQSRSKNNM